MAKLYFYYSAMNAGKTTTLLQSTYNYQERGMSTCLFTPLIDTRCPTNLVASRIGLQAPAVSFDPQFDFHKFIKDYLSSEPLHCVLVDEAQFLTKTQVYQLADIADFLNIPVLTYGLRSDFLGEPFEGSLYLLTLAEELVEIKTICHCGRKATMNQRIDAKGKPVQTGDQIEIGGNEKYMALCRRHFRAGKYL